ncbi:MAG: endonuclease/exonuclease/phosphatase family protein [Candidatus Latescibacterota bacterium]|nr:endonuclease/exonuclease/phosphatase family protein [Candidatus Latescibacterota bacterium]
MRYLIIAAIGVLAIFAFLLQRGKGAKVDRVTQPASLTVCSFNIQFLGQSKVRDDPALARVIEDCDIAVIQELVAPPYAGNFPDGKSYKPDVEAAEFFAAMSALGFAYVLFEEDTGSGAKIYLNSSATEWWVAFYRSDKVGLAADLPPGFLAADRSDHADYERVPYAFAFRTSAGVLDFVLISLHLRPGAGKKPRARRQHQLAAVARWIGRHAAAERDFIILGDMNIENARELQQVTPSGFISLNDECRPTNTNVRGPKPYDHVMFNPEYTGEIDRQYDLRVIDLIAVLRSAWRGPGPYPGDPYVHNEFRKYYSDHHPVVFELDVPGRDDDGVVRSAGK